MDIKIYSLLAALPLLYVVSKILKREELNSLDIILAFHTLYFAIIPLSTNAMDIAYSDVRNDGYIHFYAFVYYLLFSTCLMLVDMYFSKQKNHSNLLYIGRFTDDFVAEINVSSKLLFPIALMGILYMFYAFSYEMAFSMEMGSIGYGDKRTYLMKNQTIMGIFLKSSSSTIRLYLTYLIPCILVKYRMMGEKISKKWMLLGIMMVFFCLQGSRTYFLEGVVVAIFVIYSVYRLQITSTQITKGLLALVLVIGVIFPFMSGLRSFKKSQMVNKNASPIELMFSSLDEVTKGNVNIKKADNRSTRSINVYQIFARATSYKSNFNGELSLAALSHSMPKMFFPNKSKDGSQEIIEKTIGNNVDVADSVLLHFQLENQSFGFFLSLLFFLFLIKIYDKLREIVWYRTGDIFLLPLFVAAIFPWLDRCEIGVDAFLSGLINFILLLFVFIFLFKVLRYRYN